MWQLLAIREWCASAPICAWFYSRITVIKWELDSIMMNLALRQRRFETFDLFARELSDVEVR